MQGKSTRVPTEGTGGQGRLGRVKASWRHHGRLKRKDSYKTTSKLEKKNQTEGRELTGRQPVRDIYITDRQLKAP